MITTNEYEIIMDCIRLEMTGLEMDDSKGCKKWQQLRLIYGKVRTEQLRATQSKQEVTEIIEMKT